MSEQEFFWGTGRRKSSVARVRLSRGTGKTKINGREINEYFRVEKDRSAAESPLKITKAAGKYDVLVSVQGGGMTGQAGAVMLGVARALVRADQGLESALRENKLLTRDSRMKERKKYGHKGARKSFQFSKR